jgi:hypothetical protein
VGDSIPTSDDVQHTLHGFGLADDVWSTEFMSPLVIQTTLPELNSAWITGLEHALSQMAHVQDVHVAHLTSSSAQLPQGPYFLQNGRLHHAYRLYPDTAGAFVVATVPADDDGT